MAIENVQQLLTEQLGKHRCDVIGTVAMTGKDYYAIYFPVESVVSEITATNIQTGTGSSAARLQTTFAAGTVVSRLLDPVESVIVSADITLSCTK